MHPGNRKLAARQDRPIEGLAVAARKNALSWLEHQPVGEPCVGRDAALDVGRDRSSPVSHYEAPFAFTGLLRKVTMTMDDDQALDSQKAAEAVLARE